MMVRKNAPNCYPINNLMPQKIENLILSYKYWSSKYAMSSNVNDLQKKSNAFKELIAEADTQGVSKELLKKRLGC